MDLTAFITLVVSAFLGLPSILTLGSLGRRYLKILEEREVVHKQKLAIEERRIVLEERERELEIYRLEMEIQRLEKSAEELSGGTPQQQLPL